MEMCNQSLRGARRPQTPFTRCTCGSCAEPLDESCVWALTRCDCVFFFSRIKSHILAKSASGVLLQGGNWKRHPLAKADSIWNLSCDFSRPFFFIITADSYDCLCIHVSAGQILLLGYRNWFLFCCHMRQDLELFPPRRARHAAFVRAVQSRTTVA